MTKGKHVLTVEMNPVLDPGREWEPFWHARVECDGLGINDVFDDTEAGRVKMLAWIMGEVGKEMRRTFLHLANPEGGGR
jgi:hypothetical protein